VIGPSALKIGLRTAMALAVLAAAFALPAQAFAQSDCSNAGSDPTAAQYCSPSGIQTGSSTPSHTSVVSDVSSEATASNSGGGGSLPFTGFDVIALLAVAAALAIIGLALRSLTVPGGRRG
jgi:hypothetical protein